MDNNNKETRVKKWMKYREEILENQNIRESLIHSNPEFNRQYKKLSTIFYNIDFVDNKSNFSSRIDSIDLKIQLKIDEINKNLEVVNMIEKISGKKNEEKNYNSNKYDKFIQKYFADEQGKSDELNNIKVTKVDLRKSVMKKINVAIDGPSGVGKSTIAKKIADKLDYLFINTGSMYRAISYFCIKNDINIKNEEEVIKSLQDINIELFPHEQVILNDINVTKHLRSDEISIAASVVANYKEVRKYCVLQQQKYTIKKGVVMEGRDIGSVVIPDAELKIFLVANLEIRAKRRIAQLKESQVEYDEKNVLDNIEKRDLVDKNRANDPLIKMPDAIEIDTSNITIDEVQNQILKLIKERTKNE